MYEECLPFSADGGEGFQQQQGFAHATGGGPVTLIYKYVGYVKDVTN